MLGHAVELAASPSSVSFTPSGALVSIDLQAKIGGSEASPGFVAATDGTPNMGGASGVQLGLADNLVNEMLAEVHALGLLDVTLQGDYGLFDAGEFDLTLPPRIDASSKDGSLKLVIGDMIANFTSNGAPVVSAALNASIDVQIVPGADGHQIAIKFGKVDVVVNFLSDPTGGLGGPGVSAAVNAGIALQLDSVSQFLVTVPVPTIAGLTLDNLALHGDSGYLVVSGDIQ